MDRHPLMLPMLENPTPEQAAAWHEMNRQAHELSADQQQRKAKAERDYLDAMQPPPNSKEH